MVGADLFSQRRLQVPQAHEVPWPSVLGDSSINVSPGTPAAWDVLKNPLATGDENSDGPALSKTARLIDAMGVVAPSKEKGAGAVTIGRTPIDRSGIGGGNRLVLSDAAKLIDVIGVDPAEPTTQGRRGWIADLVAPQGTQVSMIPTPPQACDAGKLAATKPTPNGNKAKRQIAKTPAQAAQGGGDGGWGPDVCDMDLELRAARARAAGGGGLGGYTTVMVRHIPYKYPPQKLLGDIDSAGFQGFYDFFYLPSANRKCSNRGFAFINFSHREIAESFYWKFHGMVLSHMDSEKHVSVMPADVQGFEANAEHYASSSEKNGRDVLQYKPIFFRPLPASVGQSQQNSTARTWRL